MRSRRTSDVASTVPFAVPFPLTKRTWNPVPLGRRAPLSGKPGAHAGLKTKMSVAMGTSDAKTPLAGSAGEAA